MRRRIQIYMIVFIMLNAGTAYANSIESSTIHFEGVLEDMGDGIYQGTIPMTAGEYYVAGGGGELVHTGGGFDVYAEQGVCAMVEGYYGTGTWNCGEEDTYLIGHFETALNDAYASPGGPWGSWYDPDVADWENYELTFTAPTDTSPGYWYLRYNGGILGAGNETPMSGVMDWENMYASEDDTGAYVLPPEDHDANGGGAAAFGAGAGYWDMDWTWGSEAIPLAFPGFLVEILPVEGGKFHVVLTPEDSPGQEPGGGHQIEQLCPEDGEWRNHGAYVSCVARATADLFAQGLISGVEVGEIVSEAARSDVGKKKTRPGEDDDDSDTEKGNDKKDKKDKPGKGKKGGN